MNFSSTADDLSRRLRGIGLSGEKESTERTNGEASELDTGPLKFMGSAGRHLQVQIEALQLQKLQLAISMLNQRSC